MPNSTTRKPLGVLQQGRAPKSKDVRKGSRSAARRVGMPGTTTALRDSAAQQAQEPIYCPLPRSSHEAEALIKKGLDASEIFQLFWSEEVMESIVTNTNAYAILKGAAQVTDEIGQVRYGRRWRPVTASELRVFLAILIAMGVFRCKAPSDIWRRSPGMKLHVSGWLSQSRYLRKEPISNAMSNNRFFQIKRYLHLSPVSDHDESASGTNSTSSTTD